MSKLKFCANLTFMFQEASTICERYGLAAQHGFKAIESAYPKTCNLDQVLADKTKAQLEQIVLNTYVDAGDFGYAALPHKKTEFKDSLSKTITMAKALQCKKIHITAGVVDSNELANSEVYEENLRYAADILEAEGMIGLIEPINQHSLPNYFLSDYTKAVALITKINKPSIKLMLDLFHLQQIRGDLTRNIKWLLPYTGHIQIAQVPNRGEPNSPGEINYAYIFALLEKLGYDGWVGLEYTPAGTTEAGLGWLSQMGYPLH